MFLDVHPPMQHARDENAPRLRDITDDMRFVFPTPKVWSELRGAPPSHRVVTKHRENTFKLVAIALGLSDSKLFYAVPENGKGVGVGPF